MKEKLSIALEPEVAALYCAFFLVEKLTGCSQDEETSQLKTFSPGEQYLIVDLGGTLHFYMYMCHNVLAYNFKYVHNNYMYCSVCMPCFFFLISVLECIFLIKILTLNVINYNSSS